LGADVAGLVVARRVVGPGGHFEGLEALLGGPGDDPFEGELREAGGEEAELHGVSVVSGPWSVVHLPRPSGPRGGSGGRPRRGGRRGGRRRRWGSRAPPAGRRGRRGRRRGSGS